MILVGDDMFQINVTAIIYVKKYWCRDANTVRYSCRNDGTTVVQVQNIMQYVCSRPVHRYIRYSKYLKLIK